jgi:hypothetical protein
MGHHVSALTCIVSHLTGRTWSRVRNVPSFKGFMEPFTMHGELGTLLLTEPRDG